MPLAPQPTMIPAKQARIQFGALLDQACYRGAEYVIMKKNKPMAVIIGHKEWQRSKTSKRIPWRRAIKMPGSYDLGEIKIPLTREYMYD